MKSIERGVITLKENGSGKQSTRESKPDCVVEMLLRLLEIWRNPLRHVLRTKASQSRTTMPMHQSSDLPAINVIKA